MHVENPYQSPPEIDRTDASRKDATLAMEFETDWSPEGLRQRRPHLLNDLMVGLTAAGTVVFFLVVLVIPSLRGLVCSLPIIGFMAFQFWTSYADRISGRGFSRRYPGLAGAVHGRIEAPWMMVDGPALCMIARIHDCKKSVVRPDHADLRFPGMTEALPNIQGDIERTWQIEDLHSITVHPLDRLHEFCGDDLNHVKVSGILRGRHFRGTERWRNWKWLAIACFAIGVLSIGFGCVKYNRLPYWVKERPSHYRPTGDERGRLAFAYGVVIVGCVFLLLAFWNALTMYFRLGTYAVTLSPTMIAITCNKNTYGYHGESLNHFVWTEQGLLVRDVSNKVVFIIPADWIPAESRGQFSRQYKREPRKIWRDLYHGPRV